MRTARWIWAAAVAVAPMCATWAAEDSDIYVRSERDLWPRWQGRLSLGTTAPLFSGDPVNSGRVRPDSIGLLSDYYFTHALRQTTDLGGFRATSGLFVGSRSTNLLTTPARVGLSGRAFSVDRRTIGGYGLTSQSDPSDPAAVPYVGLGYTGLSSKGGWGFSADIGVTALSPTSAVKLGRVFSGTQNLDDLLREMRLSPMLQLGVSYSF